MEAEKPVNKWSRTKYDVAFRAEAVRHVTRDGQVATCVAQALEQKNKQLRGNWRVRKWSATV